MHEAGLVRDLLHKIQELADRESASRVTRVSVWLGALSHISAEHFRQHFENETGTTLAEGAELRVETSDDINHPQAQDILLRSIEVAED